MALFISGESSRSTIRTVHSKAKGKLRIYKQKSGTIFYKIRPDGKLVVPKKYDNTENHRYSQMAAIVQSTW